MITGKKGFLQEDFYKCSICQKLFYESDMKHHGENHFKKESAMKLVNLDVARNSTVELHEVPMYSYIRIGGINKDKVYQIIERESAEGNFRIRCVNSGKSFLHRRESNVFPLECELHYKRKLTT